jgi:predicted metal-dependent hydrolase
MIGKQEKMAALIEPHRGKGRDPHYLAFFECFNQGKFYEAHEVLEALWLPERGGPNDLFYKGLIQLAGAFVHLRKRRPHPAKALLRLALASLTQYPSVYQGVAVGVVVREIEQCLDRLTAESEVRVEMRLEVC